MVCGVWEERSQTISRPRNPSCGPICASHAPPSGESAIGPPLQAAVLPPWSRPAPPQHTCHHHEPKVWCDARLNLALLEPPTRARSVSLADDQPSKVAAAHTIVGARSGRQIKAYPAPLWSIPSEPHIGAASRSATAEKNAVFNAPIGR